ncbi:MAG: hypothetical protein E7578_02650 [Ruminococcaceae bacterium]|nr:hypothetical protein [Oscillospiraceae bacterium]
MKYADMHCDTLTELYLGGYFIKDTPLHISLDKADPFNPYIQVAAVWTDKALSDDDAYERFFKVTDHFRCDPSVRMGKVQLCHTKAKLDTAVAEGVPAFVLAVEGARLLAGDIRRLYRLYDEGVRLITLQWSDTDCIGGAWNTDADITDFGRLVLCEMASLGIAADISHASDSTAREILDIADQCNLTVCASHSNSRGVCSHMRNLTDELFRRVKEHGGIVGISMAPEHLSDSGKADITDISRHIYNYLSLGGEDTVCLGCDFDGIKTTPMGISGIGDIKYLWDMLLKDGITEDTLTKLFFGNAHRFIRSILD